MSELEQLRKEVNELRERIVKLESGVKHVVGPITTYEFRDNTYVPPVYNPPWPSPYC